MPSLRSAIRRATLGLGLGLGLGPGRGLALGLGLGLGLGALSCLSSLAAAADQAGDGAVAPRPATSRADAMAEFTFTWTGSNGYSLSGVLVIDRRLLCTGVITGDQVSAFEIRGFLDGASLGTWSLEDLTPATSWNLNFDTVEFLFPTGGDDWGPEGQQWNASGAVDDCGKPGFGFNSGNAGQDVCVDDVFRRASTIDRYTPLPAIPPEGLSCEMEMSAVR
ncbi:MAG: hypothetical protein AAF677_05620 [Pseudomonadota bacterium]